MLTSFTSWWNNLLRTSKVAVIAGILAGMSFVITACYFFLVSPLVDMKVAVLFWTIVTAGLCISWSFTLVTIVSLIIEGRQAEKSSKMFIDSIRGR